MNSNPGHNTHKQQPYTDKEPHLYDKLLHYIRTSGKVYRNSHSFMESLFLTAKKNKLVTIQCPSTRERVSESLLFI